MGALALPPRSEMRMVWPNGIFVGEQLVRRGVAQHADLGGGAHVEVGEHRSLGESPLADDQIVHAFALDLRAPVVFAGGDLRAVAEFRADGNHAGNFVLDRLRVVNRERARAADTRKIRRCG
jgi:hypothetical protein